jgi:predicted dehydrogenase
MKKTPLRLGVIGAGLAVRLLHWPALARLRDRFQIVQLADVDHAAAEETARLVGSVPITTDYRELLANAEVDAVLLSLPIHLNAAVILDAVRAGKHVIAEKPLAASWEQGRDLVRDLAGAPVVVAIAENFHFRPDLIQARAWMDAGRIGTPFMILAEGLHWSDTSEGFAGTPWRWDHQYRGAVLTDAALHHAAGMRRLGGEVEQVQAFTRDIHPVLKGPDTAVINLRFRSGCLGSIIYSGAAQAAGGDFSGYRILGTAGAITVGERETCLLQPAADKGKGEVADRVPSEDGADYYNEFVDFYAAVREGRPPRVPPAEALRDLQIIMAALDSAEGRRVVLL